MSSTGRWEIESESGIGKAGGCDRSSGRAGHLQFVYQLERPADYADNEPISDTCDVYVNLYVPIGYEYFELKDTIREYLEKAGFHVEISSFLEPGKRSTERIRRIIYDCSITKMR